MVGWSTKSSAKIRHAGLSILHLLAGGDGKPFPTMCALLRARDSSPSFVDTDAFSFTFEKPFIYLDMYRTGPRYQASSKKASTSTQCQRCLEHGHWVTTILHPHLITHLILFPTDLWMQKRQKLQSKTYSHTTIEETHQAISTGTAQRASRQTRFSW